MTHRFLFFLLIWVPLNRAQQGGVFVEAGAYNGEHLSNTLYFERYRGWTGLLVEPDKTLHSSLLNVHRKAYSINAALAPTSRADVLRFWYVNA